MTEMTNRPLFPSLARLNPNAYTEPFWNAARQHRLVCQQCTGCDAFRMPPAPYCWRCGSSDSAWRELAGTGRVYSYTVVNYSISPEIRPEDLPYTVVVVALDGAQGTKYIANLVGPGCQTPSIGAAVEVVWHDVTEHETTIPRFTLHTDEPAEPPQAAG
jgi:uncharacterized OB-fold protein